MASNEQMAEVGRLLEAQYGISIYDVGEDAVERALDDGDDPQAVVDWLAEKDGLVKIGTPPTNPWPNDED